VSGEEVEKECVRVNIVQILCIHVYKWNDDIYLLKPFQEYGERRIKGTDGVGEFN
jgi:hypothetical protein